jgi:hypothetical protein
MSLEKKDSTVDRNIQLIDKLQLAKKPEASGIQLCKEHFQKRKKCFVVISVVIKNRSFELIENLRSV